MSGMEKVRRTEMGGALSIRAEAHAPIAMSFARRVCERQEIIYLIDDDPHLDPQAAFACVEQAVRAAVVESIDR
jgi:hypothetical protein